MKTYINFFTYFFILLAAVTLSSVFINCNSHREEPTNSIEASDLIKEYCSNFSLNKLGYFPAMSEEMIADTSNWQITNVYTNEDSTLNIYNMRHTHYRAPAWVIYAKCGTATKNYFIPLYMRENGSNAFKISNDLFGYLDENSYFFTEMTNHLNENNVKFSIDTLFYEYVKDYLHNDSLIVLKSSDIASVISMLKPGSSKTENERIINFLGATNQYCYRGNCKYWYIESRTGRFVIKEFYPFTEENNAKDIKILKFYSFTGP